jgi:hypothetical protein
MALVTVEVARKHLKLRATAEDTDSDLVLKIEQASAIILAFIARPNDTDWTAEVESWGTGSPVVAVPAVVQTATLMQVADLYVHRGDERWMPASGGGGICPEAEALLRATGYRDYVLA